MKTNVNFEFISKVQDLLKIMYELANFWYENQETLEEANVSKGYPFNESFEDLTFNVYNWLLTLINNYQH